MKKTIPFFAFLFYSCAAIAADLFLFPNGPALDKGAGNFSLKGGFKVGKDYFTNTDSSFFHLGNKTSALPNGTTEKYYDVSSEFSVGYGFLPYLSFYMRVPFGYRKESKVYHADNFGLGDISSGFRISALKSARQSIVADVFVKFPTGDSSVGFNDPTQGIAPKLPLGTGTTDIGAGWVFHQSLTRGLDTEESVSYLFRRAALVQYLASSPFLFSDSNGNSYLLPVGNLEIDWGDEVQMQVGAKWNVAGNFFLRGGASYLWRLTTFVHSYTFSSTSGTTSSTAQEIILGQSHLVSTSLEISYRQKGSWIYSLEWMHPLLGKNAPITSLSYVETLLGETYRFGVGYVF